MSRTGTMLPLFVVGLLVLVACGGSGNPVPAAKLVWAAGAAGKIATLVAASRPLGPAAPAFEGVPKMPDEPTKEVILGQKPDLIIGYGLTTTPWEEIDRLGIDQIVESGQCDSAVDDGPTLDRTASFENIYHGIELYGRIFGTEDAATKAIADYRQPVRQGRIIQVEKSAIIGGIQPIEALDDMANTLAGFK